MIVAKIYRRMLALASVPLFAAPLLRGERERGRPLPRAAIWSMPPRFVWNTLRVRTASHYAEHLTMAAHIVSVPPHIEGCVVECGCYKGGSTVNLSLASALAGRELHVFDSFEGLPAPAPDARNVLHDDREIHRYECGMYSGSELEVRENVRRHGSLKSCTFHKGWFEDTLRDFRTPCVAAFVDVDLRASLETCVLAIWPQLVDGGALFVHEARHHEMASLFFDEEWWRSRLGTVAPGLVGAGTGIGLAPEDGAWRSQLGYARKLSELEYASRYG